MSSSIAKFPCLALLWLAWQNHSLALPKPTVNPAVSPTESTSEGPIHSATDMPASTSTDSGLKTSSGHNDDMSSSMTKFRNYAVLRLPLNSGPANNETAMVLPIYMHNEFICSERQIHSATDMPASTSTDSGLKTSSGHNDNTKTTAAASTGSLSSEFIFVALLLVMLQINSVLTL